MTGPEFDAALGALGISQTRLCRLLDLSKNTPSRWATGFHPVPRTVELLLAAWMAHPRLIPPE